MCGIAGLIESGGARHEQLLGAVTGMAAALSHRGPDDAGVWVDCESGIALGHRRLAVLDLSPSGRQPMHSACGRYVTVFNGEIYNFRDLRRTLEGCGHVFRGSSDTEVLLAAVAEWGLRAALARFTGMFAFALWDQRERVLYLCRDRMGEKPLYYGRLGRTFVFASELGALRACPNPPEEVDRRALYEYLQFAYVPSPRSIYSGVLKAPPASIVTVWSDGRVSAPEVYWSVEEVARAGMADPVRCSDLEATDGVEALLSDAVRLQSKADVPVGAFLSGGIDSAVITALMCRHTRQVRTFTLGFAERKYDESRYARRVAEHLGTEHTEVQVAPADAMRIIPKLPAVYGEPFADASQIPTYLVSELARRDVTVALSGDGGDEIFGGYDRYFWTEWIWTARRFAPKPVHRMLAWAPLSRLRKLSGLLDVNDRAELYLRLVSYWRNPSVVAGSGAEAPLRVNAAVRDISDMMLIDALTYLPGDILVKVDRAAMSNSLETRAPYLDHRVIEFAWRLPLHHKVRNGQGKHVLRRVLDRHVPPRLTNRPKAGFAVPLHKWIRGPLREWAEDLLDESRIRSEGFLQPGPIRAIWAEHLSGAHNHIGPLWTILMFQAWRSHTRATTASEESYATANV